MTAPWVVTCARCGAEYDEGDTNVTWRDGDWWCRFEQDCDDAMYAREQEVRHG